MNQIIKLVGIALAGVIFALLFRRYREEYAVFTSMAVGLGLIASAIAMLAPVLTYLRALSEDSGFASYLDIIFKACAIGLLTAFATEISKDAGEQAIASKIELVGKCALLVVALPVLQTLVESVKEFLK